MLWMLLSLGCRGHKDEVCPAVVVALGGCGFEGLCQ